VQTAQYFSRGEFCLLAQHPIPTRSSWLTLSLTHILGFREAGYKDFPTLWKDAEPNIPDLKASQRRVRQTAIVK
jgi:hypothetical protein